MTDYKAAYMRLAVERDQPLYLAAVVWEEGETTTELFADPKRAYRWLWTTICKPYEDPSCIEERSGVHDYHTYLFDKSGFTDDYAFIRKLEVRR